jgi:MSHA biogenesis protein MshK
MDEAVNAHIAKALLAAAAFLGAHAQALDDPTRPPAALISAEAGGVAAPAAPGVPQLQSVLIARHPGGRHVAVIDGQTVRLGGRFKGAVVSRMTETEVVLSRGAERQVLKLFVTPVQKAIPAVQP